MNEKEVAEIRRRFKPGKNSMYLLRGCYVNEKREIVSDFEQSFALMPEAETEKFLSILKKALSGAINKNLTDIVFSTQQVVEGEEHKLLMAIRDSSLKDEQAMHAFFEKVIPTINIEGNFLIMLVQDTYDVPYRSQDGETQNDASTDVFKYILCCVCPVKQTKPALSYYAYENEFHSRAADWLVSPPELGFMFPAFDDRNANIYSALYYTRDAAQNHEEFVTAVFNTEAPMPAAVQKERFQNILGDTLAEECNLEVVHGVHNQLQEMIEEHKINKEEAPLLVSKNTVKHMLKQNGVSDERVTDFDEMFDTEFGAETDISPRNIVDGKQIEVTMPDVTIKVKAERSDLIDTRVIDGSRYIVIRVEEGAEVNGVPIHIE